MDLNDPAAVFDQALASSAKRVGTVQNARSSRAFHLPLQPQSRPRIHKHKRREIAAVDETLKTVLRRLVSGLAEWPLFLHGPPGTGKTCAALALCDHLWEWQVRYETANDLASNYIQTFGTSQVFDWSKFGVYRDEADQLSSPSGKRGALLVVLDELATRERVTDTHYEVVQRVIDKREGLPLILISNVDIKGIAAVYDARIASRCEAGTVVELAGDDRRVN